MNNEYKYTTGIEVLTNSLLPIEQRTSTGIFDGAVQRWGPVPDDIVYAIGQLKWRAYIDDSLTVGMAFMLTAAIALEWIESGNILIVDGVMT